MVAFMILFVVGVSNIVQNKIGKPTVPLTYFWLSLLTCLFSILGIGLLQTHLDCLSLWGDCYSSRYPHWLMDIKPLLLWSPTIWSSIAGSYLFYILVGLMGKVITDCRSSAHKSPED
jgi:hypothetical protein